MTSTLWVVVRFPSGSWDTISRRQQGCHIDCEIWQIEATTRDEAKKKAQARRARLQRAKAQKEQA